MEARRLLTLAPGCVWRPAQCTAHLWCHPVSFTELFSGVHASETTSWRVLFCQKFILQAAFFSLLTLGDTVDFWAHQATGLGMECMLLYHQHPLCVHKLSKTIVKVHSGLQISSSVLLTCVAMNVSEVFWLTCCKWRENVWPYGRAIQLCFLWIWENYV